MFNVYFTGRYFPTGWGGASEPAAPGAISAILTGSGSAQMALRAFASVSLLAVGGGTLSGALEGVQGGTGEMGMVASGSGSMLATLTATDANPPSAGGGWYSAPEKRRTVYADMGLVAAGRGSMLASPVVSGAALAGCLCSGRGSTVGTLAVTERQEVHGFSFPTFEATRKSPAPKPAAPVAVFRPVVFADMGMAAAGAGSLKATGEATPRREDPPEPHDDDELALVLLMLEAA